MFTARGHALRVAPVILEPVAAVLLHHLMLWLLTLRDQRIANRLKHLEQRRRKILTELKVKSRLHFMSNEPAKIRPSTRGQMPTFAQASLSICCTLINLQGQASAVCTGMHCAAALLVEPMLVKPV